MVYNALKGNMGGVLHALALQTSAPSEGEPMADLVKTLVQPASSTRAARDPEKGHRHLEAQEAAGPHGLRPLQAGEGGGKGGAQARPQAGEPPPHGGSAQQGLAELTETRRFFDAAR